MFINVLFYASALLTLLGAIMVVFSRDLMHACVYLLASLIGVSGLYLTLGADFVAATQLVVYVGGIVILILFAVMLTGGKDLDKPNKFGISRITSMGSARTYIIGGLATGVLFLIFYQLLRSLLEANRGPSLIPFESTVEKIGYLLVTDHIFAFEIASVLLLGALVGAAIIARPRKQTGEIQ